MLTYFLKIPEGYKQAYYNEELEEPVDLVNSNCTIDASQFRWSLAYLFD